MSLLRQVPTALPAALLCFCTLFAGSTVRAAPAVAFLIDDMGYSLDEVEWVLRLDGPIAIAVLPDTPYAADVARRAQSAEREVLLHQPMSPRDGDRNAGPRALTLDMSASELDAMLAANLAAVPGAVGINGHMGSLLTTKADVMRELMRLLRGHGGLFFVDSYTHPESVALVQAHRYKLPATRRDVFLDHDPQDSAVLAQLDRLRRLARERGSALAIGHPGTPTLRLLRDALPSLRAEGFEVLSVTELIARQAMQGEGARVLALARDRSPLMLSAETGEERARADAPRQP